MVCLDNVRVILASAASYDWEAHQVDVQTAFLNGLLKEEVYMTTPEGVNTRGGATGNCVKLDKNCTKTVVAHMEQGACPLSKEPWV